MPPKQQTQAEQAAAIITAYQAATIALRLRLTNYLTGIWKSLGTYRNQQMGQWTTTVVPVVEAAASQMATMTSGYLSAMEQIHTPGLATPVPVGPVTIGQLRNGADPDEVYGRPFHAVWRDISAGQAQRDAHFDWAGPTEQDPVQPALPDDSFIDDAIQSGLERAVLTAQTDVQLAKTQTSQEVLAQDQHVVGYRRVLEGAYSCGLCIIASTQRYHVHDLMPIHPGCDCEVAPIYGDSDPGRLINAQHLGDAHAAIQERFGKSSSSARAIPGQFAKGKPLLYRDVLISHEHGEIGPVLGIRGQKFTGPSDLS